MKHYRWIAIVLVAAIPLLMANKCGGDVGVTSGGAAIMWGDPPTDTSVRPVGVAIRGAHVGQTVMIAAAAIAGAGTGALTAKAIRAVGNDPLSMTGDPCKDKPDGKKIAAWKRTPMHPSAFFDCAGWRVVRHYSPNQRPSIGTVLRCLSRVIAVGAQTRLSNGGAKFVYEFQGFNTKGGTATLMTDGEGRINSIFVDGRWQTCAGQRG